MPTLKEVKIVSLTGETIKEIEVAATAAVNEGGTVVGLGVVDLYTQVGPTMFACGFPALVIIRNATTPPLTVNSDDLGEDDQVPNL